MLLPSPHSKFVRLIIARLSKQMAHVDLVVELRPQRYWDVEGDRG